MGVVFRQSIKSTIVILAGNVIGALFNYFSTYVFGERLQDLGFSRIIFYIGALVQFATLLGSASVIQIFIQRYGSADERKRVLITVCSLMPLLATALALPFYIIFRDEIVQLFQEKDHAYFMEYYLWIVVLVLIWSYMTLYEGYLLSQHKSAAGLFMREVLLRLVSMAVLGMFYVGWIDYHTFIVCSIMAYCVPLAMLLWMSARTEGFGFSRRWKVFRISEYKEILHFAWYHLLANITYALIGSLDTLMLAVFGGLASVPAYAISVFISVIMTIPYRAMAAAVIPVLNKAYIDNSDTAVREIFKRSGVNILIVAMGMLMIIGFNLRNAVAILPPGYDTVPSLVLIMSLGKMADMATGLNSEIISISRHYKFNFWSSLALVILMVILGFLMIPAYGTYGAAWSISIAMIIFNTAKVAFLWHKMKLHPFTRESLQIVGISMVAAVPVYFIPHLANPYLDTVVRTGVIVSVYGGLLLWLRPSPDINAYLDTVLKNKKLF